MDLTLDEEFKERTKIQIEIVKMDFLKEWTEIRINRKRKN
jgi:hypothetical protein